MMTGGECIKGNAFGKHANSRAGGAIDSEWKKGRVIRVNLQWPAKQRNIIIDGVLFWHYKSIVEIYKKLSRENNKRFRNYHDNNDIINAIYILILLTRSKRYKLLCLMYFPLPITFFFWKKLGSGFNRNDDIIIIKKCSLCLMKVLFYPKEMYLLCVIFKGHRRGVHWAEIGTTLFPKKKDIEAKKHTSWSGGKMYAPGIHKQRAIGKAVGSLDHRKCGGHFLQPIAKTIFHLPSLLPFSVVGKLGGIRREYLEFCPYFTCMLLESAKSLPCT